LLELNAGLIPPCYINTVKQIKQQKKQDKKTGNQSRKTQQKKGLITRYHPALGGISGIMTKIRNSWRGVFVMVSAL